MEDISASQAQNPETVPPKSNNVSQVDPDLHRAEKLVSLHYDVKVNHLKFGLDPELIEARRRVDEVMAALT